MLDTLDFTKEKGEKSPCDIEVYALSTCGFCRRGLQFLRDNKITFRFIYVDKVEHDIKQKIKRELAKRFDERLGFPFVIIDGGEKVLVGFTEHKWKEALIK